VHHLQHWLDQLVQNGLVQEDEHLKRLKKEKEKRKEEPCLNNGEPYLTPLDGPRLKIAV